MFPIWRRGRERSTPERGSGLRFRIPESERLGPTFPASRILPRPSLHLESPSPLSAVQSLNIPKGPGGRLASPAVSLQTAAPHPSPQRRPLPGQGRVQRAVRSPGAMPCPQTERRDSTKDAARAGGARTRTRASRPRGPSLPPRDPGPGGAARRAPGRGAPSLRGPGSWPSRRAQLGAQLGWRRRPGYQGAQSVRTQGSLRDRWPGRAAAEPSPPLRSPCPFPFLLGALLPTCARGAPRSVSRSPPSCTLRRAPHTSGSRGSGRRPTGPSGPSARR